MNEPQVIYEDRDFVIVMKPAGLLIHGIGKAGVGEPNLANWLKERYPEVKAVGDDPLNRPGIVHRLDKDTSGLVLAARNEKSFRFLKNLFQNHGIRKTYLALVLGEMSQKSGVIRAPIGLKSGTTRRTVSFKNVKLVKEAVTNYKVLENFKAALGKFTLLKVQPVTGRTHQIRVHLNSLGHPIIGDKLYGGKAQVEKGKALGLERQFLHAESVEFTAPNGTRISVTADLPPDLEQALNQLRACREDQ